jgi:hypothetical protein
MKISLLIIIIVTFSIFRGSNQKKKTIRFKGIPIYICEELNSYIFTCTSQKNGILYPTHIESHIAEEYREEIVWNITTTSLRKFSTFTIKDNDEYMEHKINNNQEWTHEPTVGYEAIQELKKYLIN